MTNIANTRLVLYSEEYTKTSIGMYNVWTSLMKGLEEKNHLDIKVVLNKEHWDQVYPKFNFTKPSNFIRELFLKYDRIYLFKITRYLIGLVLDTIYSPVMIILVFKKLSTINPSILIAHNGGWPGGQMTKYVLVAAKLLSVQKLILVIHNYTNSYLPSPIFYMQRKLLKHLIRRINPIIVTVSNDLKSHIDQELNVNSIMIWNGISVDDPDKFNLSLNHSLSNKNFSVVGFVATFIESKGSIFLKDVINNIVTPCYVVIVGNYLEKDKQEFMESINNSKCEIIFYGFAEEMSNIYGYFDIFINCSQSLESFGLTACEAMQNRIPVICTNSGGMQEVVLDNVTGYIVEKSNYKDFAQKIDLLLNNPLQRQQMGEMGYLRYSTKFTSEVMTNSYLNIL
jgi:teichuronic acid biosynthesis glycosyltransferase TuaC